MLILIFGESLSKVSTLHDPSNFTPREAFDHQFNENALFIIQDAIPSEDFAHLRPFTVAKEAWHYVVSICKGSASIQLSNYEVVQDEADEFAMNEDEELASFTGD